MRKCTHCGAPMSKGYCLYDGEEYYCSDQCLYKNYTEEEYDSIYESDNGYWTEWEEEWSEMSMKKKMGRILEGGIILPYIVLIGWIVNHFVL